MHPKWFLSLWYVQRKPCTYLAPTLTLSPKGKKRYWCAHAYATRVASCVARSSRRIRELDNLSLRDLVKRQCTARLSTWRTTKTITLPRTDETAHAITPYRREGTNWVNRSSAFYNSLRNRKNECCKALMPYQRFQIFSPWQEKNTHKVAVF